MCKATAASQQQCHICRCEQKKLLQELPNEQPLLQTACVELAYFRMQSVQGSVCRTWKSYARHKQRRGLLKVRFIGYLRTRVTSAVSSASETSTTSTNRSVSDSPLASSTPRSHPPHMKETRSCSHWQGCKDRSNCKRSLALIDVETNSATVQEVT